ncbi:MAG: hypothetical protein ACOCWT_01475 [Desulfohalobiaceae bacterium]
MSTNTHTTPASELLLDFADRTGLTSPGIPRRYLWTDAFAVCTFLELFRRTGETRFQDLALQLVDQVHHVLGRHRDDDIRSGWLSGLSDENGERHPTAGGLRIGKSLPERGPDDPVDQRLEWEQDGQYYHYLTKWMHALHRVSAVTGETRYLGWAMELAAAAHDAFTHQPAPGLQKRMYWKMSIDLTRPLVDSMGHHDPLDGLVTYCQLQNAAEQLGGLPLNLKAEITDMAAICHGRSWATEDPLGLGGLLFDACRVTRLMQRGALSSTDLLTTLLNDATEGFAAFAHSSPLGLPASHRLAFRELGLSIGLHGLELMRSIVDAAPGVFPADGPAGLLPPLERHLPLAGGIETFWRNPVTQKAGTWTGHLDINQVMLAASLVPEGFLEIGDSGGVD